MIVRIRDWGGTVLASWRMVSVPRTDEYVWVGRNFYRVVAVVWTERDVTVWVHPPALSQSPIAARIALERSS